MPIQTVESDGNRPLTEFQTVVQQQEGIFGPLQELAHQGSNNTITLEVGTSPEKRAVLDTYDGAEPPAKENHFLICSGDCLVGGAPAKVAAYRPT